MKHGRHGKPLDKLINYVGSYKDPVSQAVFRVSINDGVLIFHRGGWESQEAMMWHYHFETFCFAEKTYEEHMQQGLIDYDSWEKLLITFVRGIDGKVSGARWKLDDDLPALAFEKVI